MLPRSYGAMNKTSSALSLLVVGISLLCLSIGLSNWSSKTVVDVTKDNHKSLFIKLQSVARQHLPSWASLDKTARLADEGKTWDEDEARLTSEVRARMDDEVPIPKVRTYLQSFGILLIK